MASLSDIQKQVFSFTLEKRANKSSDTMLASPPSGDYMELSDRSNVLKLGAFGFSGVGEEPFFECFASNLCSARLFRSDNLNRNYVRLRINPFVVYTKKDDKYSMRVELKETLDIVSYEEKTTAYNSDERNRTYIKLMNGLIHFITGNDLPVSDGTQGITVTLGSSSWSNNSPEWKVKGTDGSEYTGLDFFRSYHEVPYTPHTNVEFPADLIMILTLKIEYDYGTYNREDENIQVYFKPKFLPSSLFRRKDTADSIKYNNWMRTYGSSYGTATSITRGFFVTSIGLTFNHAVPTIYRKTESGDTYIKISKEASTLLFGDFFQTDSGNVDPDRAVGGYLLLTATNNNTHNDAFLNYNDVDKYGMQKIKTAVKTSDNNFIEMTFEGDVFSSLFSSTYPLLSVKIIKSGIDFYPLKSPLANAGELNENFIGFYGTIYKKAINNNNLLNSATETLHFLSGNINYANNNFDEFNTTKYNQGTGQVEISRVENLMKTLLQDKELRTFLYDVNDIDNTSLSSNHVLSYKLPDDEILLSVGNIGKLYPQTVNDDGDIDSFKSMPIKMNSDFPDISLELNHRIFFADNYTLLNKNKYDDEPVGTVLRGFNRNKDTSKSLSYKWLELKTTAQVLGKSSYPELYHFLLTSNYNIGEEGTGYYDDTLDELTDQKFALPVMAEQYSYIKAIP